MESALQAADSNMQSQQIGSIDTIAGPGSDGELAGFWAAVGDALVMFPLTRTVRESLVQLACASAADEAPASLGMHGRRSLPEGGAAITSAPVVGILLQLLLGCDDAAERNASLEALHCLIGEGLAVVILDFDLP